MHRILIIDDDIQRSSALQVWLERENLEVLTADSGRQGLQVAEQQNPNLIVLDLAMPDLDGLEVLDELKHNAITWDIPVMILTAKDGATDRERTLRLGASRFLQKPFSPRDLLTEIGRILDSAAMASA